MKQSRILENIDDPDEVGSVMTQSPPTSVSRKSKYQTLLQFLGHFRLVPLLGSVLFGRISLWHFSSPNLL